MNKQEKIKSLKQERKDLLKKVEESKHTIQEESELIQAILGLIGQLEINFELKFELKDDVRIKALFKKEPFDTYSLNLESAVFMSGSRDLGNINMTEGQHEIKHLVLFSQALEALAKLTTEAKIFEQVAENSMEGIYTLATEDCFCE